MEVYQTWPLALFANCSDSYNCSIRKIIADILQVNELPSALPLKEDIKCYKWQAETKYYTASVLLATASTPSIVDKQFAEQTQAIVLTFGAEQADSFVRVRSWRSFVAELDPAVRLLVCQQCAHSSACSRSDVLEWCVDNEFELVELAPDPELYDEEDVVGIKRLVQALQAHPWPNLEMKDEPDVRSPLMMQMMSELSQEKQRTETASDQESSASGAHGGSESSSQGHFKDSESNGRSEIIAGEASRVLEGSDETAQHLMKDSSVLNASALNGATQASELQETDKLTSTLGSMSLQDSEVLDSLGDEDDFEKMFSRLAKMKEQASTLAPEERKNFAEKVTFAFWKAIGGDPAEIEGLSDSD